MNSVFSKVGMLVCAMPFLMTSCMEKDIHEGPSGPESGEFVTLRIKGDVGTKTFLENDSRVLWEEGDKLWINGDFFSVTPDPDDPSCAIVYDVPAGDEYRVFYTYSLVNKDYGYSFRKMNWAYRPDNIAQYTNPMAGYSTSTDIVLRNLCGILKVGVTGESGRTLTNVSICDKDDRFIDGYMTLSDHDLMAGNFENVVMDSRATNYREVSVDLSESNVTLSSEPEYFYFVLPCGEYSDGLILTMTDTEGNVCVKPTSSAVNVRRSVFLDMGTVSFTESEPVSIDVTGTAPTSISCVVNSQAGSKLRYVAVHKGLWDREIASGSFESANELALTLLSPSYSRYLSNNSGHSELELTYAYNSSLQLVSLMADTEYKIIAAYLNGQSPTGKCAVMDARTAPAVSGVEPSLEVVFESGTFDILMFNIRAEGAASISTCIMDEATYDGLLSSGYTLASIASEYGSQMSSSDLQTALSPEGVSRGFGNLNENTSYICVVMAQGEGGMVASASAIAQTTYYVDPSSGWYNVSDNARLECGFFNAGIVDLHPLSVYRNSEKPWLFLIYNPFVDHYDELASLPYGYLCNEGVYSIIVDTEDRGAVKVLRICNNTGLYTESHGDIWLASRALLVGSGSFGSYTEGDNVIRLGTLSMWSPSIGVAFKNIADSFLYLDSSAPSTSPSVSTESFVKDNVAVEW